MGVGSSAEDEEFSEKPYSYVPSSNTIIPEFVLDANELIKELPGLGELNASAEAGLEDYGIPGLKFENSSQNKPNKGKRRSNIKQDRALPSAILTNGYSRSYSSNEVLTENLSPIASDRAQALGFSVEEENGSIARLIVPSDMTVSDALNLLQKELPDNNFYPNRIYRIYIPAANDDDPGENEIETEGSGDAPCMKDRCYGRQAIRWRDDFAKCARKLKIGIIDTHVDVRHKAFAGQAIFQKIFIPFDRKLAETGHGTSVLALLAGREDSSTPGLISEAEFYAASIFFIGDDGSPQSDTVSLLKALQWLDISNVQFVNMSFSGPQDPLLEKRIRQLRAKGMVFAAAAGNEGLAADPSYPAAYPQVIAVTALDGKLLVYPSATRGDYIDLAAPGVHIWTALPNSRAGYLSGTSFAVPFMTAVLAIQRLETLRLFKDDLLNQIKTVQLDASGHSRTFGRGLLQAPSECPNAPKIATGWAPINEISLR